MEAERILKEMAFENAEVYFAGEETGLEDLTLP